jgi:putative hemolysin
LYQIFQPIARPLNYFIQRWTKSHDAKDGVSENEIRFLIDTIEQKDPIEAEKINMLQNIFRLTNTHVKEILIPKNEMVTIDSDAPVPMVLDLFKKYRFSRLPVYDKNPENIIGIVYQKDLFFRLQEDKNTLIKDIVRPIIFVPDSLTVNELLKELKQQKIHMGIVLDEYGSSIGLVTMEDALEEIVGEIIDEHDKDGSHEKIKIIAQGEEWLVDATIDLDRLKEYLKIPFSVKTSVTIGGFLTERLQHLPKQEEQMHYKGYCFSVEEADSKRIISVRVTTAREPEADNKNKI